MTTTGAMANMQAEVVCVHCGLKKWVGWELRHSGGKILPKDVTFDTVARCRSCPSNQDYTRFTGHTRWIPGLD